MQEKQCFRCKQIKPLTEFHKSSDGKFGVHAHCRVCRAAYTRKYRSKPEVQERYREQNRERSRQRYWSDVEVARADWRQWHSTDKGQAKAKLGYAIIRGHVPRVSTLNCTHCDRPADEYHHHNGYDKEHWLDVIPLCCSCHGYVHRTV